MLWHYNKNEKARDEIIFGKYEPDEYVGGIRRFDGLSADKLQELADLEFLDLDEQKNNAPPAEKFLAFVQKYPAYGACGFVVSVKRDDYCIMLDGLTKDGGYDTMEELDEFYELFRKADDFTVGTKKMYCWFD